MNLVRKVAIAYFVGAIIFVALAVWTMVRLDQTVEPFVALCFALLLIILGGSAVLIAPKDDGDRGGSQ